MCLVIIVMIVWYACVFNCEKNEVYNSALCRSFRLLCVLFDVAYWLLAIFVSSLRRCVTK